MATQADRFNIYAQLEHLQSKHVGTGHPDITKFEWAVNMHRDTFASYIGHSSMTAYFSIAENEAVGRTKYQMLQKMVVPCGLPPVKGGATEA